MLYKYYFIIISLIRTQVINFSRLKEILLFSYRYGLMTPTHWNRLSGFRNSDSNSYNSEHSNKKIK